MRHAARILLILSTVFGASLPVPVWAAYSSYNNVTITRLLLFQGGSVPNPGSLILFTPAIADTEGCTKSGQGYAWIDWTSTIQPDGKSLYTTLLAASLAGKKVDIVVNGCSQGAYYPLVYQVAIYP
jgi:hypothetical protein